MEDNKKKITSFLNKFKKTTNNYQHVKKQTPKEKPTPTTQNPKKNRWQRYTIGVNIRDSESSMEKEKKNLKEALAPKEIVPVNFDKLLSENSDSDEGTQNLNNSLLAPYKNRAPTLSVDTDKRS